MGKGKGGRCYDICSHRNTKPPNDRNRIRKVFHTDSEEEALFVEETLIKFYGRKSEGGILQNISAGGIGGNTREGMTHTQETKDKISLAHKGKKLSSKTIEKQRIVQSGKPQTQEKRDKCSAAGKKARGIPKTRGKHSKHSKPCIIGGVRYDSQTIAAKELGISQSQVSRIVNKV